MKDVLIGLDTYVALSVLAAAWTLLVGTNRQAALAKQRMMEDSDPLIREAGVQWYPGPRWLRRSNRRRARETAENAVRADPELWSRYRVVEQELRAWNLIETAVAIALPPAFLAAVASIAAPVIEAGS